MTDDQLASLLRFINESVRPVADRLAGLLPIPVQVLNAAVGQDQVTVLGTTATDLLRVESWADSDYAAVTPFMIAGSESGGRKQLSNHHVIGILRVLVALKNLSADNPALGPLLGAVAVNPKA